MCAFLHEIGKHVHKSVLRAFLSLLSLSVTEKVESHTLNYYEFWGSFSCDSPLSAKESDNERNV